MCQPAQATATAIAEGLDVKLKKLRGMQNLNHGLWQGMCIDEVKRSSPQSTASGRTSLRASAHRKGRRWAKPATESSGSLDKLLKRHREGVIALVVPEPLATLVKVRLGQGKLGDLWQASGCHGDWQLLEVTPENVALERLTRHLTGCG